MSNLTSDVNTAIDFVLEGICILVMSCQSLKTATRLRNCSVVGAGTASRYFWHWRFGFLADYTARLFNRIGLPATALTVRVLALPSN